MKYYYRVWCPDCLDIDPDGCFEGRYHNDEELFDTPGEAGDAGYAATCRTIYNHIVVDENGAIIQDNDEVAWQAYKAIEPQYSEANRKLAES